MQQGIIHRDLKPANIKVRKQRPADIAVVQFLLDDRAVVTVPAPIASARPPAPAWRGALPWVLVGALVTLVLG